MIVIFIVWIIFIHSEEKVNHIKTYVKINTFLGVVKSSENTKMVEFSQYQKVNITPSIIYADLKSR